MKNKLVIISYSNLSNRINNFYRLDKLSQYIDIEFLNVTKITGDYERLSEIKSSKANIIHVKDVKEYADLLCGYDFNSTLIIFDIFIINKITFHLYEILSQFDFKLATVNSGCWPVPTPSIVERLRNLKICDIYSELKSFVKWIKSKVEFRFISRKLKVCRPFDYVLYSGEMAKNRNFHTNENTKYIGFNYTDYDEAVFGDKDEPIMYKYILFIDQYLPLHPDNCIEGLKRLNAEEYYRDLNKFFDLVEAKNNCKVVIAAHPKAERYKSEDFFHKRKVVFGQTKSLIFHSSAIISHYTTALAFPIIYNKPVCLVFTNGMVWQSTDTRVKSFAKTLGINAYNISNDGLVAFKKIEKSTREKYIFDYLTTKDSMNIDNADNILSLFEVAFQKNKFLHKFNVK